ncbi:GNAT family N-acetyltransferase [Rossellomorea aquimaris]|nr:GNAT family N-acetyltransferase [Rossellomorea aquimaris]WRP08742.1 GNAT family N-acetyltransferase [Rossellomorea aquimaris]
MYSIVFNDEIVGVVLFTYHSEYVIEIKNIALDRAYRGMGLGKSVLKEACDIFRSIGLHKVIVGTANSITDNLVFYQKAGFRMSEIKKDFFRQYPDSIFEDGIRA